MVRRVRRGEWREVRRLRLEALRDPDAGIAFLDDYERVSAQSDAFWVERTETAADGEDAAQFIAEGDDDWVGTVTVLIRRAGTIDHLGRTVGTARADVVGVFVRPSHRGDGTIDALFDEATAWATAAGATSLTLDVHADNPRAQGAYRRAGFTPTGETLTGPIGRELVMSRPLVAARS